MNISESSSSQSPVPPEILVPFPSSSTTPYPSPLPPPSIAPSIISSSSDTASSLSVETIQSPPKIQPGPPEETKEKDTESKRKYVQVCQVEEGSLLFFFKFQKGEELILGVNNRSESDWISPKKKKENEATKKK